MTNLLVTGGAGFIGTNFVHYWRQHHASDSIVVLDALTYAGNRANLAGLDDVAFEHGDIRDTALVERLLGDHAIDTIVHFAAESHVDRSIHGPAAFVDTNVLGTLSLLTAARSVWLAGSGRPHRFHHVSTDEVYGTLGPNDPAFSETTAYAPNSPYSASKAASDHLVRAWHHTYGLDTVTSNCSNNYGPYQFPEKLIPLFLINALHGRPLPIYGDGQQVRDWLHVEDHCRGIEACLKRGRVGETYNIGGNCEKTNIEVVQTLCAILDELRPEAPHRPHAGLISFVKDRPGHDRRYAINSGKISRELGWRPQESFESGLARTVRWYLEHPDWVASVHSGEYRQWLELHYGRPE